MYISKTKIRKLIWKIYSPSVAFFFLIIFFILFVVLIVYLIAYKGQVNDRVIYIIVAAYAAIFSYFILYLTAQASKAQTLSRIYELLSIDEKGKDLLFDVYPIPISKEEKDKKLYWVTLQLDRAATIALQVGALNELLERYWDWYFYLYEKHGDFIKDVREKKAKEFLQSIKAEKDKKLTDKEKRRLWQFHLSEIRPEVYKYVNKRFPSIYKHK